MSKTKNIEFSTTHHVKTWSLLVAILVLIFASSGYYYLLNEDKINKELTERFTVTQSTVTNKTPETLNIDKELSEIDKEVNSIGDSDLTQENLSDSSIELK